MRIALYHESETGLNVWPLYDHLPGSSVWGVPHIVLRGVERGVGQPRRLPPDTQNDLTHLASGLD